MRGKLAAAAVCCAMLFTVLACTGCGSHGSLLKAQPASPQAGPEAADILLAGLPPLASLRQPSALSDHVSNGCDALYRSANAVNDGTALILNAGPNELAWGIWGWNVYGENLHSLSCDVDVPAGQQLYLAIADFRAQRWEIRGSLTDDEQVYLNYTKHVSPTDGVFCALLAWDNCAPLCLTVTLSVNKADNAPVADLVALPSSGKAPLEVYFDGGGSSDDSGLIDYIDWDLDGDGVYSEPGPEQLYWQEENAYYTYSAPGDYLAQLRVTDRDGLHDTDLVMIRVAAPNMLPVAVLQADPTSGATPLAVMLDCRDSYDPDSSHFVLSWDFDGDGVFSEPGEEQDMLDNSYFAKTFNSAGVHDIALRATDDDGGTDDASVQITVTGNQAPVAQLTADVTAGDPSFDVHLDASGSSDPDGSIVGYEWDCDGDGYYSEEGQELDAQGSPTATYSYSAADIYHSCVRVTDDGGGADTATLDIKARGWKIVTLARSESDNCNGTSLALVDGCPAIGFTEWNQRVLRYAISRSAYGEDASDWQVVNVDTSRAPWSTSLKVVDGNPAIAYDSTGDDELLYIRSSTARGELPGDWQGVVVDSISEYGSELSMAVVDGRPAIAYSSDIEYAVVLRYAISSTAQGDSATDWHCITLPKDEDSDELSLALVDGKPAIACEGWIAGLQYLYASTADGGNPADWQGIIIDSGGDKIIDDCSLAQVAGVPAIAYTCQLNGDEVVRYAISSTPQGGNAGDWTALMIDMTTGVYGSVSIADLGGVPGLTYGNFIQDGLRIGISSSPGGDNQGDWELTTVDDSLDAGPNNSLALINGCPAVSYVNNDWMHNIDELRYAIFLQ